MEQLMTPLRTAGLPASLGVLLYALGEALFIASKVKMGDYAKVKPSACTTLSLWNI